MDSKQVSQITTGALITVVGLVFLGAQMRMGLDFGRLWPVVFLVLGVSRFLTTDADGRRGNGGWFLLLGTLFLLNNFRILGLGDSWPFFIVAAGVSIMFGRKDRGSKRRQDAQPAPDPAPPDRFGDGRLSS